jgi:hypothetical protein
MVARLLYGRTGTTATSIHRRCMPDKRTGMTIELRINEITPHPERGKSLPTVTGVCPP